MISNFLEEMKRSTVVLRACDLGNRKLIGRRQYGGQGAEWKDETYGVRAVHICCIYSKNISVQSIIAV